MVFVFTLNSLVPGLPDILEDKYNLKINENVEAILISESSLRM